MVRSGVFPSLQAIKPLAVDGEEKADADIDHADADQLAVQGFQQIGLDDAAQRQIQRLAEEQGMRVGWQQRQRCAEWFGEFESGQVHGACSFGRLVRDHFIRFAG